jgi:large subunit ribosomal protein L20
LTRVKGGPRARQRHKRVLKLTKGQRATKHALYRRAHEAMLKSLTYQYKDRRRRKRDFRRLWISRINAAARENGMPYGRFMSGLRQAGVELDRKVLADLAVNDGQTFARLVEMAKTAQ